MGVGGLCPPRPVHSESRAKHVTGVRSLEPHKHPVRPGCLLTPLRAAGKSASRLPRSQHQNSSTGTRSPLLRATGQPALPHPAIGAPTLQPDEPRSCHRATGIPPAASAASVLTAAGVPGPEAMGGTPEELRGADPLLPAADLPPAQRSPRDLGPRFPLCEADLWLLPHSIQRAGGRESSARHLAHGSTQEMGASS